jgi:hypothetical protein
MNTPALPSDSTDSWSHITALIARGGHVTFGRIAPIEGAAVAADEHTMLAALVRRDGDRSLSCSHDLTKRSARQSLEGS